MKSVLFVCVFLLVFSVHSANGQYNVTIKDDHSFPGYNEFDYGLSSSDIHLGNSSPDAGETTTITAYVHNYALCRARTAWGWYSSSGRSAWAEWDFNYPDDGMVDISFRCHDDVSVHWRVELDGVELASPNVPGCGSGDHWKIVTIHDVPIISGPHTLFLGTYQLDFYPDYCVDWLQIGDVRIEAETYDRMGGNDPNSDYRGLYISPRAANPPASCNLTVQIWEGDPSAGGILLCEDFVGPTNTVIDSGHHYTGGTYEAHYIENGGQAALSCEWNPANPGAEIYVVVDPYDVLNEIDETNNVAHTQGEPMICEYLGNASWGLDRDLFVFEGSEGEVVTVTFFQDGKLSGNNDERATLVVTNWIVGNPVDPVYMVDRSALPNEIVMTLPCDGTYIILTKEQPGWYPGEPFIGHYCVTMESSGDAASTFGECFLNSMEE